MRARCLLAVAMLAPSWACYSMQAVSVDFIPQAKPHVVEVKGQYGVMTSIENPRVSGDTVFGTKLGRDTPVALPLREIERISARRPSSARTALLIAGSVAFAGALTFAFINSGNSEPQLKCEFENPMNETEREACGV